jgi:RNA polymerase sigma-70 factor (ECF subfamily)
MKTQQDCAAIAAPVWDQERLRIALVAAGYAAGKGARRLGLSRADREDLRQDILVVLIERGGQFDPSRSGWSTFAALLARHVVADRARAERESHAPIFVPLDLDNLPAGCSLTCQHCADPILSLDLQRIAAELPPAPQTTLRLLGAAGEVAEAQRASSRPRASFYRAVADLRFWLRASGMRPAGGALRQIARATP